ncbi:hypothetical protein L3V83_07170 [Thiotrichales bacterium 19X7-9]|nr:hypothetical protein [Thiotrichales bacterium 19X7-9]
MKLSIYQKVFILGFSVFPGFVFAKCETVAKVEMQNSCPFAINVIVDNKSPQTIQPGDTKMVGDVSNGTIKFTDGINNDINTDYGEIKVSKTDTGSGCQHHIKEDKAHGDFSDPGGFDDRSSDKGSGQKKTYTWHFDICRNGYDNAVTVQAIGLGNIHIEKDNTYYSSNVIYLQPNDNGGYDTYDITFSNTTTACHLKYDYNGKYFVSSCDGSNIKGFFTNNNTQLVYICQQNSSSNLECPFLKSNAVSESYHYNYGV